MSSPVELIKSRLGIIEVVGSYIKLEKAGANFKARCPFHNEKSASFFLSPSRESYHCFGCSKGGDIFSFVQEIEGVDFVGALELLAAKAGVELKPVDMKTKTLTERLRMLLEESTRFYEQALISNNDARTYLVKRSITDESIKNFRIGYAPDGWRNLADHLKGKGFSEEEMEKAGMVIRNDKRPGSLGTSFYDRFRDRVMFPLCDISGHVVGFSGRILHPSEKEQAKYVNSPQTELYDKSSVLFGYDKAKLDIKKRDYCVLVEGQMDLVLSHQAGVTNTVAVSGTALTEKHLGLIKRLSDNLIMAFDGDLAGISAARRAIDLALALGMEVKGALLPDGLDPADLVQKDKNLWLKAIADSKNIIDFYLDVLAQKNYGQRELNAKITSEVLPYVSKIGNALDQAHFVTKIAAYLRMEEQPVWTELKKIKNEVVNNFSGEEKQARAVATDSRIDTILHRLLSFIFWIEDSKQTSIDINKKRAELEKILGADIYEQKLASCQDKKSRMALEAELTYGQAGDPGGIFEELLNNLHEELLRQELHQVMLRLKEAEMKGDKELLEENLKKCQTLTIEINNLKK